MLGYKDVSKQDRDHHIHAPKPDVSLWIASNTINATNLMIYETVSRSALAIPINHVQKREKQKSKKRQNMKKLSHNKAGKNVKF
jgi:hypothetical protein